jgi:hypothetical protein
MPLHACNSMVFASVNGDTPRHFNSHLTLRISATEKSASPKHCCDCPCSSGITLSSPCWYSEVLLLLWCSNIIATISSADCCCVSCPRPRVSAARIWFLISARKFRHHMDAVDVCGASASLIPTTCARQLLNQGVLSCTKMTFIDQRCADEHDRQLVIDHVYVIGDRCPIIPITESSHS